jgi:HPt (histidine-containing phosphotransfer) domain-containing protein
MSPATIQLYRDGDGMKVESVATGCVLDVEGALARFGGDYELFVEMAGFFLEDAPTLYSDLCDAARNGDAARVRMKAHAIKGLIAGCGGVRAANAAQKVETAGEEGDLSRISELVGSLGEELELLKRAHLAYRG